MAQTFGDTLQEAINGQNQPTLIEVTLHAPKGIARWNCGTGERGIIPNIRALREATLMNGDNAMGLMEARQAVEAIVEFGEVKLRMTPERYGYFMVNRHSLTNYNWQVKESRFYVPPVAKREPPVFTI